MRPRLGKDTHHDSRRKHGRARDDRATVFVEDSGRDDCYAGTAHCAQKAREQAHRRDVERTGVAARGDQKRSAQCEQNAKSLARARQSMRGDAGIPHDDHQLQALEDGRGARVGQAHG